MRALGSGRVPSVRAAIVLGALCAIAVFAIRVWLEVVGPLPGDQWVRRHHDSVWLQPTPVLDLSTFFSVIGTPVVAAVTVAVAAVFAARAEQGRGVLFLLLCAGSVVLGAGLKQLSGQTPLMEALTDDPTSLNFPSGHTIYATAVFGGLALLARRAGRVDVALPLLGLVLLMGPFRVIASAHFVSDVVAGYLVGVAWLAFAAALVLDQR